MSDKIVLFGLIMGCLTSGVLDMYHDARRGRVCLVIGALLAGVALVGGY